MAVRRVFLVGPMGAGKTTIGKFLAQGLGLGFADTDAEVERRTGADIPWIFDVEGEEGFRDREAQVVQEMTTWEDTVLATGGGVVVREANRQFLAERGFVVYLHATLEEQVRRTRKTSNRPLLHGNDPEGTLRDLMAVRDPLYREIADHVIDTDDSSPKTVAQRLLKELRDA
ncbi:shikimate kinase [Chromatocurvus halotolerans]|uniref:Shikimate kinase n=1 Tax=Chromatocurvus halotolerans TaxID=1132028 RepID=A0A4R2KSL8_9GAMM|nr:shikimate kinase AroK [Chromatocurvus halotolerans]TCO76754.1 shikimate kinase [Chromatocurvus halotolerans]